MLRSYLLGARIAAATWRLALVLWLVGAAFAAAFAGLSGEWLADALDGALATRRLLTDLDPNVLIDLYYYHFESGRQVLRTGVVLAVVYVILWFWLAGVVVTAVRASRTMTVRHALRAGADLAPAMFWIYAITIGVLSMFSVVVGGAAWWLIRQTSDNPSEMTSASIVAAATAVWLLGYVFVVAVGDHARLRAAAGAGGGVLRAYGWALRFVLHGGELAFVLALLLQLTGVVLWAGYQAIALTIPVTSGFGVTLSLVWAELFLLARMVLRLWFFAAQNDLQT